MTAAHALLSAGFNTALAELDSIINRRFASNRTIRVKQRDQVDEDSIEYFRAERAGMGFSVRVPDNVVPIKGDQ
jgi:hypothetical protein